MPEDRRPLGIPQELQRPLLGLISAGGFAGISVFLGRIWTQAYYGVFGLPTSDLQFSVADYAFRSKDMLLMLVVAGVVAGWLAFSQDMRREFVRDDERLTWRGRRVFGLGAAGMLLVAWLAISEPEWADGWDSFFVLVWIGGGIAAGLALGILAEVFRGPLEEDEEQSGPAAESTVAGGSTSEPEQTTSPTTVVTPIVKQPASASESPDGARAGSPSASGRIPGGLPRREAAGFVFLAILLAGLPWVTGQFAEYEAIRTLRTHGLPQVVLEFEPERAPQAIRRSDTSNVSELVNLVLATDKRIAVLYPFGCTSIGLANRSGPSVPKQKTAVASATPSPTPTPTPTPASGKTPVPAEVELDPTAAAEVCDVLTFDRASIRTVRVFAQGSNRPPNDDRSRPDIVTLPSDDPYNQRIDLTGARGGDECGGYPMSPDEHGVWYRIEPKQSGSLRFEHRPELVLISPADLPADCDKFADSSVTFQGERSIRVNAGDKLLVLVAAAKGKNDHIIKQFSVDFSPLLFRPDDCLVLWSCDKLDPKASEKGKTWRSTDSLRSTFAVEADNTQIQVALRADNQILAAVKESCQGGGRIRVSLGPDAASRAPTSTPAPTVTPTPTATPGAPGVPTPIAVPAQPSSPFASAVPPNSLCPGGTSGDAPGALVLTTTTRLSKGKWAIQVVGVDEPAKGNPWPIESWQVTLTVPPPAAPTPVPTTTATTQPR